MPKFATISPTHISGKKKFAWENFKEGAYIAIGSKLPVDLSKKTTKEINKLIISVSSYKSTIQKKRMKEYQDFFALATGDYVAVNNVNHGLFGIGVIDSGYYFEKNRHNTGSTNPKDYYCHFKKVKWVITSYLRTNDIVKLNERTWAPYGIINLYPETPSYIKRIVKNN